MSIVFSVTNSERACVLLSARFKLMKKHWFDYVFAQKKQMLKKHWVLKGGEPAESFENRTVLIEKLYFGPFCPTLSGFAPFGITFPGSFPIFVCFCYTNVPFIIPELYYKAAQP